MNPTITQRDFKILKQLQSDLNELKHRLEKIHEQEGHDIVQVDESAYCDICEEDFGWWCPDSIDHVCEYRQEDGSYNYDNCIHCHQPEERK